MIQVLGFVALIAFVAFVGVAVGLILHLPWLLALAVLLLLQAFVMLVMSSRKVRL